MTTESKTRIFRKGERIIIKPEWQDKGDDKLQWFVHEDEDGGRVGIYTPMPEFFVQPWQKVTTDMIEHAP